MISLGIYVASPLTPSRVRRWLHPGFLELYRSLSRAVGLSPGELTRACEQTAKDALMNGSAVLGTGDLVAALDERQRMRR